MKNKIEQQVVAAISNAEDIKGIGNDLVFLPEFRKLCSERFINRVFTDQEQAYCDAFADPILRYASTWAAKEAVYKAIKQIHPDFPAGWKGIEISRRKPAGLPTVSIKDWSLALKISLTISHDGDYVWALVVINKGGL